MSQSRRAMTDTAGKLTIAEYPPFTVVLKEDEIRVEVAAFDQVRARYHDLAEKPLDQAVRAKVESAYWNALQTVEQFID